MGSLCCQLQNDLKRQLRYFGDALHNGANFAFVNRMFLAWMAWSSLESVCGPVDFDLLYDAPHNMVWPSERGWSTNGHTSQRSLPARGFDAMVGTPFEYYGEPVLVPGSMGASSYVLVGGGFDGSNQSAAHGAGRALSRGSSMKDLTRIRKVFGAVSSCGRQSIFVVRIFACVATLLKRSLPNYVKKRLSHTKGLVRLSKRSLIPGWLGPSLSSRDHDD